MTVRNKKSQRRKRWAGGDGIAKMFLELISAR